MREAESSTAARMRLFWILMGCLACQMGAGFFWATRALSAEVVADLGWTRTMWASGVAPMLAVSSIGQAFVGAACVRFGVRPVVVAAVLCLGLSIMLFASIQGLLVFYAAMMLLALANAGIGDVSIGSILASWFGKRRSLALGVAMSGSNLGSLFFITAIDWQLPTLGWRQAALMVGLGAVAVILPFALFTLREPRHDEGASAAADAEEADPGGDLDATYGTGDLLRDPTFWVLFYALFCFALIQIGLVDQLVLYLIDLGYSKSEAFDALRLTIGAGIAAKLGAGFMGQLITPRSAFLANAALLAFSVAIVPFAANGVLLTVFSLAFGLATSARDVLLPLLVADRFGTRSFAKVYGLMMLAFLPGGALGPIALAYGFEVFGTYRPGFYVCVGLVLLSLVSIALLPRASRSSRA